MDIATIADIFGKVPPTNATIFHEIAHKGSMVLLDRVSHFVTHSTKFLLKERNYNGQHCIHIVAYTHKGQLAIDLMEKLVNLGADINAKTKTEGDTVLHQAVRSKNYELVVWLCQHSTINLDALNRAGWTAYRVAYGENDKTMMNILENFRAGTEIPSESDSDESD